MGSKSLLHKEMAADSQAQVPRPPLARQGLESQVWLLLGSWGQGGQDGSVHVGCDSYPSSDATR